MRIENNRLNEWFVPKFGPRGFRVFVGMLFLPYTGMCVSFAVLGSLVVPHILWERVMAISVIYALALGLAAHAADNLGSKNVKPWGTYFSRRQLWFIVLSSISLAYLIGIYYIILFTPLLWTVAVLEGFFVFAYNFELFRGLFHTDLSFSISWGMLPVIAGFIIQTNDIAVLPLVLSVVTGMLSYIHIRFSRKYKEFKRNCITNSNVSKLELNLKILSLGTIASVLGFFLVRMIMG